MCLLLRNAYNCLEMERNHNNGNHKTRTRNMIIKSLNPIVVLIR